MARYLSVQSKDPDTVSGGVDPASPLGADGDAVTPTPVDLVVRGGDGFGATAGGAGGGATAAGGAGGSSTTGAAGVGGIAALNAGDGGAASGSGDGGDGGNASVTSGTGGATSSGTPGDGGVINITAGTSGGGTAAAGRIQLLPGAITDLAYNPAGSDSQGSVQINGGVGAPGSSSNGGAGGRCFYSAGLGGTGSTGFNGGAGGPALLLGGQGGGISDTGDDGGGGGDVAIFGGFGGLGGSGGANGDGGDLVLDGGKTYPFGGGGSAGAGGDVRIGTNSFAGGVFTDTQNIFSGNATTYPPWTHTGSFRLPTVALVDGANIDVDLSEVVNGSVTLGGNRILDFSNVADGVSGVLIITQGAGGQTLTMGTNALAPGGSITLSSGAGAVDILDYYCDGTNAHVSVRGLDYQ